MASHGEMDIFSRWLTTKTTDIERHSLSILTQNDGAREGMIEDLQGIVCDHYVPPEVMAKRLAELGAPETANLLREHLPTSKKARSGDFGEVLATEVAERQLSFQVPVRRLRWKDGRNMALRGDDIVAVARDSKSRLKFLKGESKSRAMLTASAVEEAAKALDRDRGRPTRHSVLFVADRLREMGKDELAQDLEQAVLQSFREYKVEHFLFTLSGNKPDNHLFIHLRACRNKRRRYAIGVHIKDHGSFIEDLFSRL